MVTTGHHDTSTVCGLGASDGALVVATPDIQDTECSIFKAESHPRT
jgi:hypothetical protein